MGRWNDVHRVGTLPSEQVEHIHRYIDTYIHAYTYMCTYIQMVSGFANLIL